MKATSLFRCLIATLFALSLIGGCSDESVDRSSDAGTNLTDGGNGARSLKYPFAVFKHASGKTNVLLVGPVQAAPADPDPSTTTGTGSGTLSGTVKNADDRPIGEATIKVGDASTETDFNGAYTLSNAPTGTVTVEVSAAWYATKQQSAEIAEGTPKQLEIVLEGKPLAIDPADKALAEQYNQTFDWTKDTVSVSVVERTTQAALEAAIFHRNPEFYRDTSGEAELTPSPLPTVTSGGGQNFVFEVGASGALDPATIRDRLAETPVAESAQKNFLMWEPTKHYLTLWDSAKVQGLKDMASAIAQQGWGGSPKVNPQRVERVFLHDSEIWVQVVFEKFVRLGSGISDADNDGRSEVYAKVDPAHYTAEVYEELANNYAAKTLDTLGLRDALDAIETLLYDVSKPEVVGAIGEPFQLP